MEEVLQEPFSLTQGDSDVTGGDSATSASVFYDIWLYHVPTGIGLVILPGHTFSLYIYTNASAEGTPTHLVKVSVMDASKQDRRTILGPVLYQSVKEFVDRDKLARFNVTAPVKVYEKQYVAVECTGDGTYYVDESGGTLDSYFEMNISRIRQPL